MSLFLAQIQKWEEGNYSWSAWRHAQGCILTDVLTPDDKGSSCFIDYRQWHQAHISPWECDWWNGWIRVYNFFFYVSLRYYCFSPAVMYLPYMSAFALPTAANRKVLVMSKCKPWLLKKSWEPGSYIPCRLWVVLIMRGRHTFVDSSFSCKTQIMSLHLLIHWLTPSSCEIFCHAA